MISILKEKNKNKMKVIILGLIFLHVILIIILLIFIPKLILVLLGVVLPTVFEFLYRLWVKLFQIFLPLGIILSSSFSSIIAKSNIWIISFNYSFFNDSVIFIIDQCTIF